MHNIGTLDDVLQEIHMDYRRYQEAQVEQLLAVEPLTVLDIATKLDVSYFVAWRVTNRLRQQGRVEVVDKVGHRRRLTKCK
jgi:DNA-binding transcriptional regulator LsrR (DeoR family)